MRMDAIWFSRSKLPTPVKGSFPHLRGRYIGTVWIMDHGLIIFEDWPICPSKSSPPSRGSSCSPPLAGGRMGIVWLMEQGLIVRKDPLFTPSVKPFFQPQAGGSSCSPLWGCMRIVWLAEPGLIMQKTRSSGSRGCVAGRGIRLVPSFLEMTHLFGDKIIRIKWSISVAFIRTITMIMIHFCVQNNSRLGFGHSLAVRPPAGACPSTNPWAPASLPETLDSDWLSASPPLPLWPISFEQPCALRPGVRGNLVTYLSFLPIFSYR